MDSADVAHAVYVTVKEFPARRGLNSVESAAQTIGRAVGTTYNKADPGTEDQAFTVHELVTLMLGAQDYRPLHAIAASCDHVAVSLTPVRSFSDAELLTVFTKEQEAFGGKARAIRAALDDGRIDEAEMRHIRAAVFNQVRATMELLSRLEGMCHAHVR